MTQSGKWEKTSSMALRVLAHPIKSDTPTVIGAAKGRRFLAIGPIEGRAALAVVFAPLGSEAISIISMRRASRKEREKL